MSSLAISLALVAAVAAGEPTARKPNILLIYSDDHGWADLGAHEVDRDIRTPHLDQLARDGVVFRRGYVTAPQCVPSRAGVITGRYQQRFGVEDNRHGPLPLAETTIAERLRPAGYVSGFVGKCHLDIGERGDTRTARLLPDHMPHHQGFDEYWRGELRQFHASHDLQGRPFDDAPRLVTDTRFRVVVQTEAALSFLDRRASTPEQPWFLYLAWYAPHVPLESPEPWFSQTSEELPLARRQALAMIAAMDDGLGRIRAKLREFGQERDTLIFFIGDNGAPLGNSWDGSLNLPMQGQKGMLSEGGIRVPFVAAWPEHWPAGRVYEHPVISLDVAATAAGIAGLASDERLDGVNLSPYLTGEQEGAPHDTLYWRWVSQAAVLEMPYKLVCLGDHPPLLFDITTPEGERIDRDLAASHPEIVRRLEGKLREWGATLQPPGLVTESSALSRRHEELFAEHHILPPLPSAATGAAADGSFQGWIARNGTLSLKDGALRLAPEEGATGRMRPFLTCSSLRLAGPVTATLRLRAEQGGPSTVTWRTRAASFEPRQAANFDWPAGAEWREVRLELAEEAEIIHVRITPAPKARGVELRSIELRDRSGTTQRFDFSAAAR